MIKVNVVGFPAPKGSKTSFVVKRAGTVGNKASDFRAVTTDKAAHGSNSLPTWKLAVTAAVQRAIRNAGNPRPMDDALDVTLAFWLPRPASTPNRVVYPTKKPDVDKLARAALDICSKVVWTDDARIVTLTVQKRFAIGRPPGLTMLIDLEVE
jgi:Holliday junction resolvase RusA-like endonuclease